MARIILDGEGTVRVHLLLEKAPWQDLRRITHEVKGITARRLLQHFEWLRGELYAHGLWTRGYHRARHTTCTFSPGNRHTFAIFHTRLGTIL